MAQRKRKKEKEKEKEKDKEKVFPVYLCPTRNTLFLTTVERAVDHKSSSMRSL